MSGFKKVATLVVALSLFVSVCSMFGWTKTQAHETGYAHLDKDIVVVQKGKSAKITLYTAEGKAVKTSKVTWQSDNKKVAIVKKGKITGKKVGTTYVVASYKDIVCECKVLVVAKKSLKTVELNGVKVKIDKNIDLGKGEKLTGSVGYKTIYDSNNAVFAVDVVDEIEELAVPGAADYILDELVGSVITGLESRAKGHMLADTDYKDTINERTVGILGLRDTGSTTGLKLYYYIVGKRVVIATIMFDYNKVGEKDLAKYNEELEKFVVLTEE